MHRVGVTLLAVLLTAGCTSSPITTTSSSTATVLTTGSTEVATDPTFVAPTTTTELSPIEENVGLEIDLGVVDAWRGHAILSTPGSPFLWLAAGGGEGGSLDAPEVYLLDPGSFQVLETLDFQGSVFLMDGTEDAVWFAKWGDGAAPESFVAWYDLGSGDVQETSLGQTFSPSAIAAVPEGLWLAQGNGWPAEVGFFDKTINELTTLFTLEGLADLTGITVATGARWGGAPNLWISDFNDGVRQVDPGTGATISESALPGNPLRIGASSDLIWVLGLDGSLWAMDSSGAVVAESPAPQPNVRACCLLTSPISDSVFMFYENGAGYWVAPTGGPFLAFQAGQEFVTGIAEAGTGIWTTGETLTRVELGQ